MSNSASRLNLEAEISSTIFIDGLSIFKISCLTNKFKLGLINGISKETSFEKIETNKCFDYSFYYKYNKIYVLVYNFSFL